MLQQCAESHLKTILLVASRWCCQTVMDSFQGQSKHSDWLLVVEGGESARKLIATAGEIDQSKAGI